MEFEDELDEHDVKRWQQWQSNVKERPAPKDDGRRVELVIDSKSVTESLRQFEERIVEQRRKKREQSVKL